MTARAVHWHEGMFLQPHQFQAEHRYLTARSHRAISWPVHHTWGLRSVAIDTESLTNNRLVVRSLQAVFRDGTPIEVPADGLLPTIELKGLFEPGQPLMVYLAIPALNLGKANVAEDSADPNARYRLDTQELEDENTGVNPQPIRVRLPNLRLLVGDQDQTGFSTLPLVRLVKSQLANAPPEVDVSYIPPVLACDTWQALHGDILQSLFDRIGRKRERLASALASRGGVIAGGDPQDAVSAAHLRELNESYAVLSVVAFTPGIPPLLAYTELCRLVGQLAIFDRSGRWPAIPPYDHDDLGGCFYRVKVYLDTLLDILPEPEYKERPFVGMGLRMQAAIEPTWLDPAWELYLGVRSEMDPDEMMRLLTVPGQLDMKVGSGDRVDAIYQLGQAGLRFEPCPKPGLLPDLAGQRYCQLGRQPEREWGAVTRSLTVAARFNETRVVGAIQGQRAVTVRTSGGRTNTMTFTLYAVPAG